MARRRWWAVLVFSMWGALSSPVAAQAGGDAPQQPAERSDLLKIASRPLGSLLAI